MVRGLAMQENISSWKNALCQIICQDIDSIGTGFFVREDGILLTGCHVVYRPVPDPQGLIRVQYSQNIRVKTATGSYPASVVHDQSSTHAVFEDYAVLRISDGSTDYLQLGDYDYVEPGDKVLILGYPFGVAYPCVTSGMISSKHRSPSHVNSIVNLDMIQIDGAVNKGNSGGPLIHVDSSSVVGIVLVRLGGIDTNIDSLKNMNGVSNSPILSEIVSALEVINTYLNPGIGQAASIAYARAELDRLGI